MPLKHHVHQVTTSDGVPGLLIDVPGATVFHYEIFFRGGYHAVDGVPQQTAHVLEHMVASNTSDPRYKQKDAFLNDLYRNGAYTNAATYYAGIWYYADCEPGEWGRMIDLHRLAIEKPLLTEKTLKAELGNAAGEMKRNINLYARLSSELARQDLNLETFTSAEQVASFEDITLTGIKGHYARTHTRANMQFIVTGDLAGKHEAVVEKFADWELVPGERITNHDLTVKHGGSRAYKQVADLPSIYISLSMALPRNLTVVETQALELVNSYLFNVMNAKVFGEVRRQGLAYEMRGATEQDIDGFTLWTIKSPIPLENVAPVLDLIFAALGDMLADHISAERFTYAKTYSTGRTQQYGQTVASLGDLYSQTYSRDGSVAHYEDVAALFDEVTPELVRGLVREIVTARNWTIAGVGSVTAQEFDKYYALCTRFFEGVK